VVVTAGTIGSHKQPLDVLNPRPTLEALEKDWAPLQDVQQKMARK
jgi:hypothetical protein